MRVEVSTSGAIATVTLNRPDKKNALTLEMFQALTEAGEALAGRADLRAVILTGAGQSFCAGLDLGAMQAIAGRLDEVRAELAAPLSGGANWYQRPCRVWQELKVPVIAAVEGHCLGAGMQLALAADFRLAAPSASFSIMEAKWGLVPDMGLSTNLPSLMRADQAKELMMTARTLGAEEAASLGLVTRLCDDPQAEARAFAAALTAKSPDAIAGAKRLVEETWNPKPETGLGLEAEIQAAIIGQPNQIEAVLSNLQKRTPKFSET